MNELAISLSADNGKYLYEQIYDYIVGEIKKGKLREGEKLPSTRSLADYLQIARSTVELAYEQLCAEGYLESKAYKGYFVTKIEELISLEESKKPLLVKQSENLKHYTIDFSPNGIETSVFPQSVWKTLQKNALSEHPDNLFELGDAMGELDLRGVIANYLHASRGVECQPEQIIVGAGNDYLLMLLGKIRNQRQIIAMEQYTYKRAWQVLKGCGYQVKPVMTDESGISVEELRNTDANLVYVMPSHQFPLGIVMPVRRRLELLSWANEKDDRYVIEDDYDSEFRYRGKPIPALQELDKKEKVIYIGTFSKAIAPAIRISYLVLPSSLLQEYKKNAYFYASTVSRIEQIVLKDFIEGGYFERHLNKMRKAYKLKHDLLLQELQSLKGMFRVTGENAGLHLVLTYEGPKQELELLKEAEGVNIKVYTASEYFIDSNMPKEIMIILGFAGLNLEQIKQGISLLGEVWIQN